MKPIDKVYSEMICRLNREFLNPGTHITINFTASNTIYQSVGYAMHNEFLKKLAAGSNSNIINYYNIIRYKLYAYDFKQ